MNSQEVLIAFAKLSHAEKEFAVTESMETSRQYSQHVSSLSSQLAAVRKELFESDAAHSLKNAEINSLKDSLRQNRESLRDANGRIDQLTRQLKDREQTIVTLARQVDQSATGGAGAFTPMAPPREPTPEKPFGFPPVHPSFNCAGKVVWPSVPVTFPEEITLLTGGENDESTQRFARRLSRNNALRSRVTNVYKAFIEQGFNADFARRLVKAMYQ